jgi:hypothetical protein
VKQLCKVTTFFSYLQNFSHFFLFKERFRLHLRLQRYNKTSFAPNFLELFLHKKLQLSHLQVVKF